MRLVSRLPRKSVQRLVRKADMQGQPCTPGYTELRDGCRPADGSTGSGKPSTQSGSSSRDEGKREGPENKLPASKESSKPPQQTPRQRKVLAKLSRGPAQVKNLGGGQAVSRKLVFPDGTAAVYKPKSGEPDLRVGITPGTLYRREVAAYRVAAILGLNDLVPETDFRDDPTEGEGSAQAFVSSKGQAYKLEKGEQWDGDEDAARAAIFDIIIGNTDAHNGNHLIKRADDKTTDEDDPWQTKLDDFFRTHFLVKSPKNRALVLIDHGLSFPHSADQYTFHQSNFVDHAVDRKFKIPPEVKEWKGRWPAIEKELTACGIEPEAIAMTKKRFDDVVSGKYGTIAELPHFRLEGKTMYDYRRGHR